MGSELTGVLYILDEPSIGLHQRDNIKLLKTLCHLRDIGNTLIVIEHDRETMDSADWIVDIGPGAGLLGGQIVARAPPADPPQQTLPHRPLSRRQGSHRNPRNNDANPRSAGNRWIVIRKAAENNLADIDVRIPLGLLVAVTGVSGAGKSTLINQILYPALARKLHSAHLEVGRHDASSGSPISTR